MANATEIYSELVNFLANQLSLDSFHAWLVASAWDAPPILQVGILREISNSPWLNIQMEISAS